MSTIIDRRLNPSSNNAINRQRFIERIKGTLKNAVKDNLASRSITDITGDKISVPVKDAKEPIFRNDSRSGSKNHVLPGNKEFVPGDKIKRPPEGQGQSGEASDSDSGEHDSFVFNLTPEEYFDLLFENLALPNLTKHQSNDIALPVNSRAGITSTGSPNNLDIVRSTRNALGRRLALKRPSDRDILLLQEEIDNTTDPELLLELQEKLVSLKRKSKAISWIDPIDLRYRSFTTKYQPRASAVIIFMLDVSGSMSEHLKDLAKRFFMIYYIFLCKKYGKKNVNVHFIRFTSNAREVDEQEFFHGTETGGTVASTALAEADRIMKTYDINKTNFYLALSSDGDDLAFDTSRVSEYMEKFLPIISYFVYMESREKSNYYSRGRITELWNVFSKFMEKYKNINQRFCEKTEDLYPIFKDLFAKETVTP